MNHSEQPEVAINGQPIHQGTLHRLVDLIRAGHHDVPGTPPVVTVNGQIIAPGQHLELDQVLGAKQVARIQQAAAKLEQTDPAAAQHLRALLAPGGLAEATAEAAGQVNPSYPSPHAQGGVPYGPADPEPTP